MTLAAWLEAALADADARNLPALRPHVDNLARSSAALRAAEWNSNASGNQPIPTKADAR